MFPGPETSWLVPTHVLHRGALRPGLAVGLDRDGLIVGPVEAATLPAGAAREHLPGMALLPGFVNAHSHAFQRLLRGGTENGAPGTADDFWSWREAMYRVVQRLDPDGFELATAFAFVEMVCAGFTHVGEFHYLHRDPSGHPYADPNELSRRVGSAAATAGIGLTLLRTAYERGGAGRPPGEAQRRFVEGTEEFARAVEALHGAPADGDARLGIAVHSSRAVSKEGIRAAADLALRLDLVVHAHVAEQRRELAECEAEHGLHPMDLLDEVGLLSPRFAAVHATWLGDAQAQSLGARGAHAVICPTTERNLGDGLPDLERLRRAGASLAIGTDSHARIDPFAELRGLEDGERLRALRRVVLQDDEGRVGPTLLTAGTRGGARSLALSAGEIESGLRGDLVAIDLSGAEWDGLHDDPTALLGALWLTGSGTLVRHVWVMGMKVVDDGWHPARDALRPHWARLIHEMR